MALGDDTIKTERLGHLFYRGLSKASSKAGVKTTKEMKTIMEEQWK